MTELNYSLHLDRDYVLQASVTSQKFLPLLTATVIRPLIIYILIYKSEFMSRDIRYGYLANQVTMFLHEFNVCFLFRLHAPFPYAALYCDAPICRMGLSHPVLMGILSLSVIWSIPTFLFILIRIHQRIVANSESRWLLSQRAQIFISLTITLILLVNVMGFGRFSSNCDYCRSLAKSPDLFWLVQRGGTLFLFGPPGRAQYMSKEAQILGVSVLLMAPFFIVLNVHATLVLRRQNPLVASRTQQIQNRLARVFLAQMTGVTICYVFPLTTLTLLMVVDFSQLDARVLVFLRFFCVPLFVVEGLLMCLIFLFKSPSHRQILKSVFFQRFSKKSKTISPAYSVTSIRRRSTIT